MSTKVGTLYFDTAVDLTGLKNGLGKMQATAATTGKSVGKSFSGALSSVGLNPAMLGIAGLTAAVVKLGKEAYDFSNKFNSAMLEVKTISKSVQDDYEGMSKKVLNLSTLAIKDDAIELNKALYQIVSAGYDGADGLMVLEAAAKAATGGVTETITAADGLTTVLNAWGKTARDVNQVSDLMFTTVRLGKTTMGELSSSIAQVAPLASSMGVSMEEVFAAVASLTKQGVPTAQAMTQIRSSLIGLNETLGDGWADSMTYQEALQKIVEISGGSQTKMKELMGRIEGVNAVLGMTGQKSQGAAEDLKAMSESAGAANAAFEIMAEDTDIKWNRVSNMFKARLKDMGQTIEEASAGLADFLAAALTGVDGLGEGLEGTGEEVEGFLERMSVLRNEGNTFLSALTGAMTKSDEKVQGIVEKERAEYQVHVDELKAIQDEYNRMKKENASEDELAAFKNNLQERYNLILNEAEKENQIQQKYAKQAKTFAWLTLGVGTNSASREGIKAKETQDEVDVYKMLTEGVKKLGEEIENTSIEVPVTPVIPPRTIQDIDNEIKDLEEKRDKFAVTDIRGQLENEKKILALEREKYFIQEKIQKGLSEILPNYEEQKLTKEEINKQAEERIGNLDDLFEVEEDITDEEKEQNKQMSDQIEKEIDLIRKKQRALELTEMVGHALGTIGTEISKYNSELGDTITMTADLIIQTTKFAASIKGSESMSAEDFASILGMAVQVNTMIFNLIGQIGELFGLESMTMDDLLFGLFGSKEDKAEKILGFGPDDISNIIVAGVTEGLELSKDGLGDWNKSFGDMLEGTMKKYLNQVLVAKYMTDFTQKFKKYWEDDFMFDQDEIAELEGDYKNMVNMTSEAWKQFEPIIDKYLNTTLDSSERLNAIKGSFNAIKGSFNGMSQETANLMEGRLNSIQFNIIDMKKSMDEQQMVFMRIERNTSYNHFLEDVHSELAAMRKENKQQLQGINEKLSTGGNYGF
ncbi:MAG: phage tail tape measure protein [Bacteroidales bacterium]|nr:phage tail tape measure protein [Bacteroidales bacterium]